MCGEIFLCGYLYLFTREEGIIEHGVTMYNVHCTQLCIYGSTYITMTLVQQLPTGRLVVFAFPATCHSQTNLRLLTTTYNRNSHQSLWWNIRSEFRLELANIVGLFAWVFAARRAAVHIDICLESRRFPTPVQCSLFTPHETSRFYNIPYGFCVLLFCSGGHRGSRRAARSELSCSEE